MAPIRSKWTSRAPPEVTEEYHVAFDSRLGQGIALATISAASFVYICMRPRTIARRTPMMRFCQ
ncbi:hypothetical protein BD309DRAFT_961834 [Dichomitus squalens]|nr:hypothetical protein BD309DRAFT_961834 [Dichomitus squalens]